MPLTQCAVGGIVHNEKRNIVLYAKLQHAHNVGMFQADNDTSFITKLLYVFGCQLSMQYFDSSLSIEVNMLTQVDISEASPSQ